MDVVRADMQGKRRSGYTVLCRASASPILVHKQANNPSSIHNLSKDDLSHLPSWVPDFTFRGYKPKSDYSIKNGQEFASDEVTGNGTLAYCHEPKCSTGKLTNENAFTTK